MIQIISCSESRGQNFTLAYSAHIVTDKDIAGALQDHEINTAQDLKILFCKVLLA